MNESSMASISEFMISIDIEGSAFVPSLPISKSMTIYWLLFRLLVDATVPLGLHCGMRRPMEVELDPVNAMLDEIRPKLPTQPDQNCYTLGKIGGHNIVITVLPGLRTIQRHP